jgi:hypothetical protein
MQHIGITDEKIKSICEFVRKGVCFRDSYLLAGINNHTGSEWRKQAIKDKQNNLTATISLYIRLSDAMDVARAEYHAELVQCVREAGREPKHWQAAMTLLERTKPEVYSRFVRLKEYQDLDINPAEDSPVVIISKVLTAIVKGKVSTKEGEQIANIIGALVKTEENTEIKQMLSQAITARDELKKDSKSG